MYDGTADGRGTIVLSYKNGTVCESDAWCRGYIFNYVPQGNKVVYGGVYLGDECGSVAHMEDGYLVEEHYYYMELQLDEQGMETYTYKIDEAECTEAEFEEFIETYFDTSSMEDGWVGYDTLEGAYSAFLSTL